MKAALSLIMAALLLPGVAGGRRRPTVPAKKRQPYSANGDIRNGAAPPARGKAALARRDSPHRLKTGGGVTTLVFSPDSSLLAVGNEQNVVTVWDKATRRLLHTLKPEPEEGIEEEGVTFLAFSPDGRTLAAALNRRMADGGALPNSVYEDAVVLWDTSTWQVKHLFTDLDWVDVMGFSADGKTFEVETDKWQTPESGKGAWDVETGRSVPADVPPNRMEIDLRIFSPDGKQLLDMDGDSLRAINVKTRRQTILLRHTGIVNPDKMALSPDGKTFAVSEPSAGVTLLQVPAIKE